MEIRFYHLTRQPLDQALPPILEKTLERGWRAVVQVPMADRLPALDAALWAFRDDSFLPHASAIQGSAVQGSAIQGNAEDQPIWLTAQDENPNNANVMFLTDGLTETKHSFDMICILFSDGDAEAREAARAAWKKYNHDGHVMAYWQQTPTGWEKKA